ncbi:MAG TPA: protein kinase [Blastocatellia bacterium]|jgi:serine/threonine protein kinase|nr:protein kinase [Blastocatellia bacterium]
MTSHSVKEVALNSNGSEGTAFARELAEALSGRFEILELLGHSDGAAFYMAQDLSASGPRLVRLKVFAGAAGNEEMLDLFRLEAQAASSLSHRNILSAGSEEQVGPYHFCVIEHSPGANTLRGLLDKKGWLDASLAATIAIQVARALEVAHEEGVLHLKISPDKILIKPDGSVQLADFGIEARPDLEWARARRSDLCSPLYASPEQASGAPVDHRSDLYSLGVVLFEALTDRVPFDGESSERIRLKHRTRSPLSPDVYCESVPRSLSSLVMRLLEKDPRDRFESASELRAALAEFAPAAFFEPAPEVSTVETSPAAFPAGTPSGEDADAADSDLEDRTPAPALISNEPEQALLVSSFNTFDTFDLDFDIEPLGNLLPEAGLQKPEHGAPKLEELESAHEWRDLSEREVEGVVETFDEAPVMEAEDVEDLEAEAEVNAETPEEDEADIRTDSIAPPKPDTDRFRERRLAANSQRIAEKIRVASVIEAPVISRQIPDAGATRAPLADISSTQAPAQPPPALQSSKADRATGRPEDRGEARVAMVTEPAPQRYERVAETSGSSGRSAILWVALAAIIALSIVLITFADRFPKLRSGGSPDAPAERGRETGTFVPTPASAMPESAASHKANAPKGGSTGGEAGGDASNGAGANNLQGPSNAKPAKEASASPREGNGEVSLNTPSAVAKPEPRRRPAARKAKTKSRIIKSSPRPRATRRGKPSVYNPRYN